VQPAQVFPGVVTLPEIGFERRAAEGFQCEQPYGVELLRDRKDVRAAEVAAEK